MTDLLSPKTQTCRSLLKAYTAQEHHPIGQKLTFAGVDGRDVYNITAPFEDEGELVIAGRVEGRNTEYSDIMFFICKDNVWEPRKDTRSFKLQDPFYSRINGQLIIGGVEIKAVENRTKKLHWKTVFYRGKSISQLELFANGPNGMKDIRMVELPSGRIGIFTRPMGKIGGRGKIGFVTVNTLDELNCDVILNAKLIHNQFLKKEWGGANELHLLKNGNIGVLGHIASYDKAKNRHYYSVTFSLNPDTGEVSTMKMIAARADFPMGAAKKTDLVDVIFSGGIVRTGDKTATLYVGVSDVEAHSIVIPDPFIEYEC